VRVVRSSVVVGVAFSLMLVGSPAWAAPAAPSITSPVEGAEVLEGPVVVTGTSQPGVFVPIYEGTDQVGLGVPDDAGIWSTELGLADGVHTIRARAVDLNGDQSPYSDAVTFTIDLPPASPGFTAPGANATVQGPSVQVRGTAENGATVTVIEDGEVLAAGVAVSSGVWITTLPFTDGAHTLSALATDARGRESTLASRTFSVDSVPPAAPVITGPTSGSFVGSATVNVNGTAEAGPSASWRARPSGARQRPTVPARGARRSVGSPTALTPTPRPRATLPAIPAPPRIPSPSWWTRSSQR